MRRSAPGSSAAAPSLALQARRTRQRMHAPPRAAQQRGASGRRSRPVFVYTNTALASGPAGVLPAGGAREPRRQYRINHHCLHLPQRQNPSNPRAALTRDGHPASAHRDLRAAFRRKGLGDSFSLLDRRNRSAFHAGFVEPPEKPFPEHENRPLGIAVWFAYEVEAVPKRCADVLHGQIILLLREAAGPSRTHRCTFGR